MIDAVNGTSVSYVDVPESYPLPGYIKERVRLEAVLADAGLQGRLINERVLIWSSQRQCWWRPEGRGYAMDPRQAGAYTFEEAFRRTSHCGPEKGIAFDVIEKGVF